MKGRVLISAVLLTVVGTYASAADVSGGNGASWTPGLGGNGAGAVILNSESSNAALALAAVTHPAGSNPAGMPAASAGAPTVDTWMAGSEEAGLPASGGSILDNILAMPSSAAAWWFGSALLGLTIVARRRDGKSLSED